MASTYISRTLASNGQKKGTISVWFKTAVTGTQRAIVSSYYDANYHAEILLSSNDQIDVFDYRSGYVSRLLTTRKFRDTNAWYHLVYEFDSTNGTADDRNKLWINGVQETAFDSRTNYGSSASTSWDTDYSFRIGARNSDQYWDGLMSHLYFIQGYCYNASTFGSTDSTTGEWKINTSASVNYSGTGTNSCLLKMEDSSNMDLDSSGNDLSFTTTGNLTSTQDCPSNVYTTWNYLCYAASSRIQSGGWDNGSTFIATTTSNESCSFPSSLAFKGTGKYYIEFKVGSDGADFSIGIGEQEAMDSIINNTSSKLKFCNYSKGWAYTKGGNKENNGSGSSYGDSFTDYDYIGVAYNNGSLWFSKNGTWQNSATAAEIAAGTTTNAAYTGIDTSKYYYIMFDGYNDAMIEMNAGNGYFRTTEITSPNNPSSGDTEAKFKYPVPTGLQPISTKGFNE